MTVEVGTEIPPWTMPRVDPQRMKTMAAILRDPYPVHWDREAVAPITGGGVINQGPLNLSYIANMLMDWQGHTCIRRLQVRFTDWVLEDDEVTAHGTVTGIEEVDGERRATCDIRLVREQGDAVIGTAVVALGRGLVTVDPAVYRVDADGTTRPWISVTTLGDLLDRQAQLTPDVAALALPDERATYRQLADRADHYARALLGLGVEAGETVGLLLPPRVDYVAALFGAAKIGAIPVLMNARFKARELRHVAVNGDLAVVLTSTSIADAVDFPALLVEALPALAERAADAESPVEGAPKLRRVAIIDDDTRPGFLGGTDLATAAAGVTSADVDARQIRVRPSDVGLIMYTSGTTASPKGAMLSHEALVRQGHLVGKTRFALTPDDACWTPLPMFHIGGMSYILTCFVMGCTAVHAGHFDADVALRQLVDEHCTVALPAFETIWLQVLDHPEFATVDLSRIRLVLAVGVPERLQLMQDRFPQAPMVTTFGGTESTSHLSIALPDDPPGTRLTTGGHPLDGIEVRIIDHETGLDLPANTTGEIVYRGWNRFLGYYNEPELTAEVIDAGGWFHSGDVGTIDVDGRVSYIGRIKDMLKVGGENVAAAEIEGHLVGHPAVQIVQVVSAPDARYSEVPAAFVELRAGATTTEQELIDHCRGQIATFKVPRYVRFVTEWPMSGTKIKKYVLREQIAAELDEHGITEAPKVTSG